MLPDQLDQLEGISSLVLIGNHEPRARHQGGHQLQVRDVEAHRRGVQRVRKPGELPVTQVPAAQVVELCGSHRDGLRLAGRARGRHRVARPRALAVPDRSAVQPPVITLGELRDERLAAPLA